MKRYVLIDGAKLGLETTEDGSLIVEELISGDKMIVPADLAKDFLQSLKGISKETE